MAAGAVERVHIHKHLGQTEAVFLMVASLKMSPRNMVSCESAEPTVPLLGKAPSAISPLSPPLSHPLSRCLSVYEVYMGGYIETTAPHVPLVTLCHHSCE